MRVKIKVENQKLPGSEPASLAFPEIAPAMKLSSSCVFCQAPALAIFSRPEHENKLCKNERRIPNENALRAELLSLQ